MRVFVWRKRAGERWLAAREQELSKVAGSQLVIIQAPNRKMAVVEVAAMRMSDLEKIRARFGGTIEVSRDWLKQGQKAKPIKIGKRLIIAHSRSSIAGRALPSSDVLIIPAAAAFGTGEHATTAMSLRLLEQITRGLPNDWSMLDLGTGTGILALAARKFRAKKVVAIDSDPVAVSIAKENARLNEIRGVSFRIAEARKICSPAEFHIVSANLYSELLIEILPKLKGSRWLILSGILREQEAQFCRALKRNRFQIVATRRRGKWIALLARHSRASRGIPRR